MSSDPTATISPGWPVIETTRPVTGEGISTAALSVMTSAMTWSSSTDVADLDLPLDDFGGDRAFAEVRHLEDVAAHEASMTAFRAFVTRTWPGKYSHSKACG